MKNLVKVKMHVVLFSLFIYATSSFSQVGAWDPELEAKAKETIKNFETKDASFKSYFNDAYGYAIFPSVAKGGFGIGGAHGRGLVFEQGEIIGEAKLTQVNLGLQFGGQAYSEVIFFEDSEALKSFTENKLKFSGQASAVAITHGASADLAYSKGVAVYTLSKAGFMYEASLGGQKFKYLPIKESDELIN